MSTKLIGAFITWACDANAKCNPCAPTVLTYELYIMGSTYNQPTPMVYVYYYNEVHNPDLVTATGTFYVTALSSKDPKTQSWSLEVSATGYVQLGANALSTPLLATDTGIKIDMYTTSYSMTGDNVAVQGALAPTLYLVPPFTTWTKPKTPS